MSLTPVPDQPRRNSWVDIVEPAALLAKQIADTDFVPKAMRGNPAVVTACILFGDEIGIGPLQSLAKINIIDGKPAPSAELARALVLSDGHDMWVEEANTTRVVMAGKRANSTHTQKVTWTLDDAKKAGLSGKQNWARYPRQMLLARCSIELARMIAPDSLGGISTFAEELDEAPVDLTVDVPAPAPKKATRKLQPTATVTNLPSVEQVAVFEPTLPPLPDEEVPLAPDGLYVDEELVSGVPEDNANRITPPQIRKIMATYNDLGVVDRLDQKRITAQCLSLEQLDTHNNLTQREASILIDMLSALDPFQDIVRDDEGHAHIVEVDSE